MCVCGHVRMYACVWPARSGHTVKGTKALAGVQALTQLIRTVLAVVPTVD